jgi:hypothetical protein
MIQNGKITFDCDLDTIKETHFLTRVTFNHHQERPPEFTGALLTQGGGRSWSIVHANAPDTFRIEVDRRGAEVGESRNATLEEIFLARVGRNVRHNKAA